MDEIDPLTQQILLGISEEQWLAYYNELVIYAEMRCRRWMWRTGSRENLPRGFSPDAIAREAVTRLYDGRRKWNHERYPGDSPVPFLKGVIDSIVSAIGRSSAHKTTASLEDEWTARGADGETYERELEAAEGAPGFRPPASSLPSSVPTSRKLTAGLTTPSQTGRTWWSTIATFQAASRSPRLRQR